MASEILIRKGKRGTAAFIQTACSTESNPDLVNDLLDVFLDPTKPIDDWDMLDWCRWIVAGGKTPDEYAQIVRRYDNATTCGLVWTANFVAYRCRTCGISPCMSLCSDCFQRGNHEGHDFNMFRSQAGGACDCGDKSVMRESGFCHKHIPKSQLDKPVPPPDLLCVARAFMPRAFLRLIQHFRDCYKSDPLDKHLITIQEADGLLNMLHQHSELGAAMRDVMTQALTDTEIYNSLALTCDSCNPEKAEYLAQNFQTYKDALRAVRTLDFDLNDLTSDMFNPDLKISTFLNELVFWTVHYEFPQKLVCMLLNMMPDLNYKEAFTRIFVHHYPRIGTMLAHSTDSDTLSNRVVHVSVQLFSNEKLAYKMAKEFSLLFIMVKSLKQMMYSTSMPSILQCPGKNYHHVVDCNHRIMKEHCYWPLVSDLNNVLTHRRVALEFLRDSNLLNMWFSFLSLFQGMNVNQRELKTHVEFESNSYYAAFSAELEASATPMWALILHLTGRLNFSGTSSEMDTLEQSQKVLTESLEAIKRWLHNIGFNPGDSVNPYQVSFHLPLHRCFASFLCHAVRHQGMNLCALIPVEDDLKLIMMHPLQAQVAFYEILAGMWVRCGLQIKGQAMTYIQCHFCNSIVDADLLLLQLCIMFLDPNWFLKTVMQRFHVWEWFTFHPNRINSFLEPEHVLPMLEGALTFITTLIVTNTNIGKTQEQVTRKEIVSLLCMSDRTHSQLLDLLPDKCGSSSQTKDFESILTEVADYRAPNFEVSGTMVQGTFVPKAKIWEEEYDPIHILLRAVHRREYQASLDRYTECLRQNGKYTDQAALWPPYRIPGPVHEGFEDPRIILHSKTMHGLIFTVLFRALNDPDVSEQILALCIYLLDMAVRFPNKESRTESCASVKDDVDLNFGDWFPGNDTLTNITVPIQRIVITENVVMSSVGMVEEMEVEEEEEDMDAELECLGYQVQSPVISEEDNLENASHQASPPRTNPPLALPSTNDITALVPLESSNEELVNQLLAVTRRDAMPSISNNSTISSTSSSASNSSPLNTSLSTMQLPSASSNVNMAMVPTSFSFTTMHPRSLKFKEVPGQHRLLLTDPGLPQIVFQNNESASTNNVIKTMPFCSKRLVEMNESILSLLIALYSKLYGKPDAYKIPSKSNQSFDQSDCRIGTGVDFIRRLIDQIVLSGSDKEAEVKKICHRLWPKSETSTASFTPSETIDKEERRRKAKERQQKLMAEFASKQKAFLQKTKEAENKESVPGDSNSSEMLNMRKEYQCVICGQNTLSGEERPMGMAVLLQATSVLGHSHQDPSSARYLPCSDEERFHLQKEKTLAYYMSKRFSQLARYFDNKYWQLALNIGWEGGVHVQSCGHYLHIDCHRSYMTSLKTQQATRNQNINVERGEYACPLCRQLANSVIPLNPAIGEVGAVVCRWGKNLHDVAAELSQLMTSSLSERESNLMKIHMHSIMEDLTNTTYPQYRSVCSPNSTSLFLFLCSIARTNLEIELIQKSGSTPNVKQKACFVPLLHVLSMHSRVLTQNVPTQIWTQLTGQTSDNIYSVAVVDSEVPLLLRDCVAILLQLILTLPLNIDKVYFSCIVQVLYNIVYVQAVTQLSQGMSQKQRMQWKQFTSVTQPPEGGKSSVSNFTYIFQKVTESLEQSSLYLKDEDMDPPERTMEWTEDGIEHYIQGLCLHFLQIASLLQSHLYPEQPFDLNIKNQLNDFSALCTYLSLLSSETPEAVMSTSCLKWATIDPPLLIRTWCFDFTEFVNSASLAARKFLRRPMVWYSPALLKLPENYDQIFQYYHRRPCSVCHSVPKDPSLCLVCGTMVCLRENCCRQQAQYEAVLHSVACGAGTAMYLAVNSSTIIVIRGKRACLWGSVYLDSFGEEDRDLKRGKPLFLSKERYELLQSQWLNHGFNHTNKRWVWHKDNL